MEENWKRTHTQYCSAPNCPNSRSKCPGMSFFRFPKDKERNRKWIENSNRLDLVDKDTHLLYRNYVICADHFEEIQFMNAETRNRLVWNAIPTVFGGATSRQLVEHPVAANSNFLTQNQNADETGGSPNDTEAETTGNAAVLQDSLGLITNVEHTDMVQLQNLADGDGVVRTFAEDDTSKLDQKPVRLVSTVIAPHQVKMLKMRRLINKQRIQLWRLKKQLNFLKAQVQSEKKDNEIEALIRGASKYMSGIGLSFFGNQLRSASKKKKGKRWTRDDKLFTLSLYYQSPEAYRLCGKVFGLPSARTLQRWIKLMNAQRSGFQEDIELQAFKERLLKRTDGGGGPGGQRRLKREGPVLPVDCADTASGDGSRKPTTIHHQVCLHGPGLFGQRAEDDPEKDTANKSTASTDGCVTLGPLTTDIPLALPNDTINLKIVTLDLGSGDAGDNIFPLFQPASVAGGPLQDEDEDGEDDDDGQTSTDALFLQT